MQKNYLDVFRLIGDIPLMAHDFPDFDLGLPEDDLRGARGVIYGALAGVVLLITLVALFA